MLKGFYRAFEDRFRGSREMIRSRLEAYLPFVEPLKSLEERPAAIDLGCGRGEWLELLKDSGFDPHGIDLDEQMLAACHENGLSVEKGDAIAYLEKLPDESCAVVSGFHIAEHLPFSQLQILVYEALRVLKSGGLLILETPNPENIKVSSLSFHLDPTHHNPLPPALLAFLPEYCGFERVKVIRLQESAELRKSQAASLEQVLSGVSPDYAVVAQKRLDETHAHLFDEAFNKQFGLQHDDLVKRFDQLNAAHAERVTGLERSLDEERRAAIALETRVDEERRATAALETRVDEERKARNLLEAQLVEWQLARTTLQSQLAAVHASTSWRITAPLRSVKRYMSAAGNSSGKPRWFAQGIWAWVTLKPGSRPRRLMRRAATRLAGNIKARSRLANAARSILTRYPALRSRLQAFIRNEPELRFTPASSEWKRNRTGTEFSTIQELDVSTEAAGVERVYLQAVQARRHLVGGC